MSKITNKKIAIIGYGELGKAIHHILRKDLEAGVWDKMIRNDSTLEQALEGSGVVFLCVPSWCVREAIAGIIKFIDKKTVVVCLAKGIENESLKTMDEILEDNLAKSQPMAILSGPMLASEIVSDKRSFAVVGAKKKICFEKIKEVCDSSQIFLEHSSDVRGVALAGVLKNIYAFGIGMADGLELGSNFKGALIKMAIKEMAEIEKFLGGKSETVLGFSGIADLIATAFSEHSRNRRTGEIFAKTGDCCLESEGSRSIEPIVKLLGKKSEKLAFLKNLNDAVSGKIGPKEVFERIFVNL